MSGPVQTITVQPGKHKIGTQAKKGKNEKGQRLRGSLLEAVAKVVGTTSTSSPIVREAIYVGDYLEVVCYFDENLPESVEYALHCEDNLPATWDDESRTPMS